MPSTVSDSLPVLFFGDPWASAAATIGINPSWQEYILPNREKLCGAQQRFETLHTLGAPSRRSLSDSQADAAINRMRQYFDPNKPVYSWFRELSQVVEGMGLSFGGRSAVHLDLVQESTYPAWSKLIAIDPPQAETVLRRDLPFLKSQIERFPFGTLVCTSARVLTEVGQLFNVRVKATGRVARVKWTIGTAEMPGRSFGIVGWNIPLKRATGLKGDEHQQFGRLLAVEMKRVGIDLW